MNVAGLWVIFSLSFITSLSGALMPGPMLTYTIARTAQSGSRGWLLGPRVVVGHAVLALLGLVSSPHSVKTTACPLARAWLIWSRFEE